MITKSYLLVGTSLVLGLGTFLHADEVELGQINVEAHSIHQQDDQVSYTTTHNTDTLANHTTGTTLGDYLSNQMGVESASYGPAVGRPVVRGMDGYRVGLAQGGIMLNDLSAMSQDHAVGLNARVAERIELIKGPASLLYGSYSGGVVRALGEEHEAKLPKKGVSLDASVSTNTNTGFGMTSIKSAYAFEDYSFNLNYYRDESEAYQSGGEVVPNSDTYSEQLHAVLGWKISPNHTLKVYADTMDKIYGVANATKERTEINMEQQRYGAVLHSESIGNLKNVITEFQYSYYNHYELENGRYDGRFEQIQQSISSEFDFDIAEGTDGSFRVELLSNALKVCHEHGNCEEFEDAIRTSAEDGRSLLNYYNVAGIPYSHGHPMPNMDEKKILLAPNVKHYFNDTNEMNVAANIVLRSLTPDASNIQETWLMHKSIDPNYYNKEDDVALSFSAGWWHSWSDKMESQMSLSYMERLPSSQEMFWNGFHHATESYILGNRDIDKERSVNLDMDAVYKHNDNLSSRLSLYYYDFANYIYQSRVMDANGAAVSDPFHNSPVYSIRGERAKVYGAGIEEKYKKAIGSHLFTATAQLNLMQGKLDDAGNIPRMPPYNATFCLEYDYEKLHSEVTYKWVSGSRPANDETLTDGYDMLSFSMRYHHQLPDGALVFWLKGDNLTDVVARDNMSFLKETAPLVGRSVALGMDYKF